MSKSTEKSAYEVDAAAPTSPLKKEDAVESEALNAKKLELEENKTGYEDAPPAENGRSDSDSEDGSSAPEKTPAIAAKNGDAASKKKDETSSDEDVATKKPLAAPSNPVPLTASKKENESNGDSDFEDKIISDENVTELKKASPAPTENASITGMKKKEESSVDSEDKTSDEEEPQKKRIKTMLSVTPDAKSSSQAAEQDSSSRNKETSDEDIPSKMQELENTVTKKGSNSERSFEDEDSSEEEEEKGSGTPKKIDGDVERTANVKIEGNVGKGVSPLEETPETPSTPKEQTMGSKTLYVGNLSFSVEQADIEDFFHAVGEIVSIRFAMNSDDTFRGFGYVEFASAEVAEKAILEMNGKELLRRRVRLDLARERGSYTPYGIGQDKTSFHWGGRAQGQTIFIRGFNKDDGVDQIRSSLEELFGSCGQITRVTFPRDQDGGIRGIAYIDFNNSDAFNQALELNGSKFRGKPLLVEAAKPMGNSRGSTDGGGRGGRRIGDRGFGGRFGGGMWGGRNGDWGSSRRFDGGRSGDWGSSRRFDGGRSGDRGSGRRFDGGMWGGRSGDQGSSRSGFISGRCFGGEFSSGRGFGGGFSGGRGFDGGFSGDRGFGSGFSGGRGFGGGFNGGGRGFGGGFNGGGRGFGGGFNGGGRGFGGAFGGGGGFRGGRGHWGGDRGRGTVIEPNIAVAGTGQKTTLNDEQL